MATKKKDPPKPDDKLIITVSARTNDVRLGDSLARYILAGKKLTIAAMGAYAVNQMVKGLTIARVRLLQNDIFIQWYSSLHDAVGNTDGKHVTVVKTKVIVVNRDDLEDV